MSMVQTNLRFKVRKNPQRTLVVKDFYGSCKENTDASRTNVCGDDNSNSKTGIASENPQQDTENRIAARKRCTSNEVKSAGSQIDGGSPPKREKCVSATTPSTTPSQLLMKLNLTSPKAKSDSQDEKHLTPKKLFDSDPAFHQARKALHCTSCNGLPGREEQLEFFQNYLQDHLLQRKPGTVYVSGPPGTGKSACLKKIMGLKEINEGYRTVYINCTALKTSQTIYSRICSELNLKTSTKTVKEYVKIIEKLLCSSGKMILFILDEIDQLDSRNQSVLYTLFEWPSKPDSKLVLIGIANALDLTDRVLPRLQARVELKPTLVHFPPYTKQQIVTILSSRLSEFNVNQIFSPAVVHLLAAKVASVSGDARRALDIGRRVIEIAESRLQADPLPLQPIAQNESNSANQRSPRKSTGGVDTKLVMDVLNNIYGTSQTLNEESAFPIQQKVLVCTLLLLLKSGPKKDISLAKLHEVYRRVCSRRNILAVDQAEFRSLCQMVEIRGIIRLQGARKEARLTKVCLQWDEEEVAAALKDKQLLAAIMNDKSAVLP
ncbi:cell division control protein 6 homolog [Schistocerca nitens]|uniref:cell division control protein 6 homolog n=1 Tax=Schistocerca nitens TaxID=7011 RepID=UPI0021178A06|nr:cell division control protein 6 homolog [Schistocerca nitens]